MAPSLILASSSPRRKALLAQIGLQFEVFAPDIDETWLDLESPADYVARLATAKAQAVLQHFPQAIVIAADTSLDVDGDVIAKPESKQHAFDIWQRLSGRAHEVLTGVCVAHGEQLLTQVVRTEVHLQHLSPDDMQRYWDTGEPQDKAGAYAIQGFAAQYVTHIVGSYSNVVGLPLFETTQLLQQIQASSP